MSKARARIAISLAVLFGGGSLAACSSDDAAAFCDKLEEFENDEALESLDPSDPAAFEEIDSRLGELEDAAPDDDVKADVGSLRAAMSAMGDIMQEVEEDPANALEAMADLEEMVADVEATTTRLDEYTQEQC